MESKKNSSFSYINKDTWVILVLGALGVLAVFLFWTEAFPAASLKMSLKKKQIVGIARSFAHKVGMKWVDRTTIYFSYDKEGSIFLEYELGNEKANELMKSEIPIWRWKVWLYNDEIDDPMLALLGLDGKLQSLEWKPEKNKLGDELNHRLAREKIVAFVKKYMDYDLNKWGLILDRESKLSGKTKHVFTFEDKSRNFGGGTMRVSATVNGSTIVSLKQYLHVPDQFNNKYRKLRAENKALSNISMMVTLVVVCTIPFFFLWFAVKGQIRWRTAITLGICTSIISFIKSMNDASAALLGSTGWDLSGYSQRHALEAVPVAFLAGLGFAIFFGTVEVLYRKYFPKHIALEKIVDGGSVFRSRIFLNYLLVALAFSGLWLFYGPAFYSFGKEFGIWCPLGLEEVSILSNLCPAYDALELGLKASFFEELGFRVFMLILLQKITRSFWLANLIQAATWGFGHCNYLIEPPYARGVELTILGTIAGYILKRYGLLAVVIPHYFYDAFLTCTPLFNFSSTFHFATAILVLLPVAALPLLSLYLIGKHGEAEDKELLNSSIHVQEKLEYYEKEEIQPLEYNPLNANQISLLMVLLIVLALIPFAPRMEVGKRPVFTIDRTRAIQIARDYCKKKSIDIEGFESVVSTESDKCSDELEYVFKNKGYKRARELAKFLEPRYYFDVKFFKPGLQNYYFISIGPDGKVVGPKLIIDEHTKGKKIEQSEAILMARDQFVQVLGSQYRNIDIKDITKKELENRVDYKLVAEIPELKVRKAPFVVSVATKGEYVSDFSYGWKLPKSYKESIELSKRSKTALTTVRLVFFMLLILSFGYWVLKNFSFKRINWRVVVPAVLFIMMLRSFELFNRRLNTLLMDYKPNESLDTYYVSTFCTNISTLAITAAFAALIVITLATVKSRYLSKTESLARIIKHLSTSSRLWSDGILIGYTAAFAVVSITFLSNLLQVLFNVKVDLASVFHYYAFDCASFTLDSVLSSATYAFLFTFFIIVVHHWVKDKNFTVGNVLAFILMVILMLKADYVAKPMEYQFIVGADFLKVFVAMFLISHIGKNNWVALFFTAYFSCFIWATLGLTESAMHICPVDAWAHVILLVMPFLAIVFWQRKAILDYISQGIRKTDKDQ